MRLIALCASGVLAACGSSSSQPTTPNPPPPPDAAVAVAPPVQPDNPPDTPPDDGVEGGVIGGEPTGLGGMPKTFGTPVAVSGADPSTTLPAGVPAECRSYIHEIWQYAQCQGVPAEARDAMKQAAEQASESFRTMGPVPPESQKAMSDACKQGTDAMKQAMAQLTC